MEAKKLCIVGAMLVTLGCEQNSGTCTTGKVGDCPQGTVCYAPGDVSLGAQGTCVVGELDEEGRLKMAVSAWKVFRDGLEIAPLRFDSRELHSMSVAPGTDNPQAGWLGKGAAELHVTAEGSADVETRLDVIVGNATYACEHVPGKCRMANCDWTCALPRGWAGEGTHAEVKIRLGERGFELRRLYRVATPPQIRFEMAPSAMVGEEVVFCATREEEDAVPVTGWNIQNAKLIHETSEVPVEWKLLEADASKACWRTTLPLAGKSGAGAARLEVHVTATDAAGSTLEAGYKNPHFRIERVLCQTDVAGMGATASVTEPLAFASNQLVFGAGNQLYFYNRSCEEEEAGKLHSGAVKGPMVVMGNTGRVAAAITSPERNETRLVQVNASTRALIEDRGCEGIPGRVLSPAYGDSMFDKGLALMLGPGSSSSSGTDWILAAPANADWANGGTGKAGFMMVFWPNASEAKQRCRYSYEAGVAPIRLTPVQAMPMTHIANPQPEDVLFVGAATYPRIVGGVETMLSWQYYTLDFPLAYGDFNTEGALLNPTGLAAATVYDAPSAKTVGSVWLSGQGLQRLKFLGLPQKGLVNVLQPTETSPARTSPAAVDDKGRAYVVVETLPEVYELHRFEAQAADNENSENHASLPAGSKPVGSPLLGEPINGSPAELYVVMTNGTVLAFEAAELALLWKMELGFEISQTAQPVLVSSPQNAQQGNLLWIVGERGQVRALRVGSNGLNRSALWPKAFRDNCNSSSRQVHKNMSSMLSCF